MKFLLDTNICIYIINNRPKGVLRKFKMFDVGDIAISSITVFELLYGAYKSSNIEKNRESIRKFLLPLEVINFGDGSADLCGKIRANLERQGKVIGILDMQIAAIALANNLTLITNNTKEFKRVSNLRIENWVTNTTIR